MFGEEEGRVGERGGGSKRTRAGEGNQGGGAWVPQEVSREVIRGRITLVRQCWKTVTPRLLGRRAATF